MSARIVGALDITKSDPVTAKELLVQTQNNTPADNTINDELIKLINLHARRDHKKYMFAYSETAPKNDLVVEWQKIVADIPAKYTSNKKQFRISHWKSHMRTLAKANCISKVSWR